MKKGLFFPFVVIMIMAHALTAQNQVSPLTQEEKSEVIDSISRLLNDNYVFPDVAKKHDPAHHKEL